MHQSTAIGQSHVAADEYIVCDCLPEDLHAKHIGYDFFRFSFDVRVDKGNMIVTADDVAESRQTFLDPLYFDGVRDCVAEMLELLVGGGRGDKEAFAVTASLLARKSLTDTSCV